MEVRITVKSISSNTEVMSFRDVPSYGVYIIAYEWLLERWFCDRSKGEDPTPLQSVWVGGIAGTA